MRKVQINSVFGFVITSLLILLSCNLKDQESDSSFKGHYHYGKAKYYQENFDLDSAWFYSSLAVEELKKYPKITPLHFEVYDQFIKFCINKRKNQLGLSYAQQLCDFEEYDFIPNNKYKSKAYAILGNYLFRIQDFEGSEYYTNLAIKYASLGSSQKLIQDAYLSQFFNYILWEESDETFVNKKMHILDSTYLELIKTNGDLSNYNRAKGYHLFNNSNYKLCIQHYQKAIEYELSEPYCNIPILYSLYFQLSEAYEKIGQFDLALETYNNVKRTPYSFISDLRRAKIYHSKYVETRDIYDWNRSVDYLLKSDSSHYRQMNVILEEDLLDFFNYRDQLNKLGMSLAFEWYSRDQSLDALKMFFSFSEKNKSALMQHEVLLTRSNFIKDEKIRAEVVQLKKNIKKSNVSETGFSSSFNSDIRRLEDIFSRLKGDSEKLLKVEIPKLEDLQNWCSRNDAQIISQNIIDNKIYMISITECDLGLNLVNINSLLEKKIKKLVRYSRGLNEPIFEEFQASSNFVYTRLFQDVLVSSEKIVFSPDGIFNVLNIETLVIDTFAASNKFSDLNYLIHNYDIYVSTNIRRVLNKKENYKKDKIAVFSFSNLETLESQQKLNELPGAFRTAKKIKNMYPYSVLYLGKDATKSNFFEAFKNPEISTIHLALHGASSGNKREDVKLFFRNIEGGIDTLYGFELMGINTKIDRIVLAACESTKGVFKFGEGSYTLSRYFQQAGVSEIISNYTSVQDEASSYLFKNYYKENDLRMAKLKLIKSEQFCHPKIWGASQSFN